jgi:hypothetical protein
VSSTPPLSVDILTERVTAATQARQRASKRIAALEAEVRRRAAPKTILSGRTHTGHPTALTLTPTAQPQRVFPTIAQAVSLASQVATLRVAAEQAEVRPSGLRGPQ